MKLKQKCFFHKNIVALLPLFFNYIKLILKKTLLIIKKKKKKKSANANDYRTIADLLGRVYLFK